MNSDAVIPTPNNPIAISQDGARKLWDSSSWAMKVTRAAFHGQTLVQLGWVFALSLLCGTVEAGTPSCSDLSPSERRAVSSYALSANPDVFRLQPTNDPRLASQANHPAMEWAHRPFSAQIERAARLHDVDPELIHAIIDVESGYNPKAVSLQGARGLMQVMPGTARRYGVTNIHHPECNIRAGAAYLRNLLDLFGNDVSLALAAYNAGENAVIRHGRRVPPYKETRRFVPKVVNHYARLKTSRSSNHATKRYPPPRTLEASGKE